MTDTLVFDIETQNFFTDPEVGWNNFEALKISVVCAYSYEKDAYVCFEENQMDKCAAFFSTASRLVGFSSNRYDVPVLQHYFSRISGAPDLWKMERVDLLEEIELATGRRVSLSQLAQANLGVAKDRHGSEAIGLYKQGRMIELKEYCQKDVELTRRLYDQFKTSHSFLIPDRATGQLVNISFLSS